MKTLAIALFAALLPFTLSAQPGADRLKAVTTADDARLTAMKSADPALLGKVFGDDLHYAHSTGVVDTKDSFTEALATGKSKYLELNYLKREFSFPADDIALMTGQVRIKVDSAGKGVMEHTLSYLGVWKLTPDGWRFVAWQSAKLPVPEPAK